MTQIAEQDAAVLREMYARMLDERNSMLAGLERIEDSDYRRTVYVDSLILGALHHLHEVATNLECFRPRIQQFGGDFMRYANNHVQQVISHVRDHIGQTRRRPSTS